MEFRGIVEAGCMLVWLFVCVSADVGQTRDSRIYKRLRTNIFPTFGKRPSSNSNRIPYRPSDLEPGYNLPSAEADDTFENALNEFIYNHRGYPWSGSAEREAQSSENTANYLPWNKWPERVQDGAFRRTADGKIYR